MDLTRFFYIDGLSYAEGQVEKMHYFWGFPEPANEHMVSIIDMYHNTVITLFYIFLAVVYFVDHVLTKYSADKNSYPIYFTKWQESMIDAFVVLVPLIVIWYLTVPAVGYILHNDRFLQYLDSSFTIEIVGHQWYWTYYLDCIQNSFIFDFIYFVRHEEQYPYFFVDNSDIETLIDDDLYQFEFDQMIDLEAKREKRYLAVNKVLVLPANEFIRCLITSEDVIHSWALPQLGIKVDAIPGRIQMFVLTSNKYGVFYGQCSELCGVNHGFMPICVEFVSESQFIDWYLKNLEVRPYKLLLSCLDTRKSLFV